MIMAATNNGKDQWEPTEEEEALSESLVVEHGVCEVEFGDGSRLKQELVRIIGFDECVIGVQLETHGRSSALVYDAAKMVELMEADNIPDEAVGAVMSGLRELEQGPHTPVIIEAPFNFGGFLEEDEE